MVREEGEEDDGGRVAVVAALWEAEREREESNRPLRTVYEVFTDIYEAEQGPGETSVGDGVRDSRD